MKPEEEDTMESIRMNANGLEFEILVSGRSDRLMLLLHGFPDDARSFLPMMRILNDAGYMCAAPYMRGYWPTSVPESVRGSRFATIQIADLAADAAAITLQLKARYDLKAVYLVGHDWGAIAAYGAVNHRGDLYDKAVMMSVPPGPAFLRNLFTNPSQLARSWYILFFQVPDLPEHIIRSGHGEFIAKLWRDWSGDMSPFRERMAEVIDTLSRPHSLRAALAYYRGLLRPPPGELAKWNRSRRLFLAPVQAPALILSGETDHCISSAMFKNCEKEIGHAGGRYRMIKKAGHFLPLEAPEKVVKEILQFVAMSE